MTCLGHPLHPQFFSSGLISELKMVIDKKESEVDGLQFFFTLNKVTLCKSLVSLFKMTGWSSSLGSTKQVITCIIFTSYHCPPHLTVRQDLVGFRYPFLD